VERRDIDAADSAQKRIGILLVGAGPMLAMLDAALQKLANVSVQICLTASEGLPASEVALAKKAPPAPEATLAAETAPAAVAAAAWEERVALANWVLFGSGEQDLAELRDLDEACRRAGTPLLPGITVRGAGLAGPLVQPGAAGGWEAAWRRIRPDALGSGGEPRSDAFAEAMLANVMIAEWLKEVSQDGASVLRDHVYLLRLDSLEGRLHPFLPHPVADGERRSPLQIDAGRLLRSESAAQETRDLFPVFERLTSPVTGIFHAWDEADLVQLPLSQCLVQTADPLSASGAELLPQIIRAGLTHLEARREAGLAGIEAYAARLAGSSGRISSEWASSGRISTGRISSERQPLPIELLGIGSGATVPEAFNRALTKALDRSLMQAARNRALTVRALRIQDIANVEDIYCRYCLQALAVMQKPVVGEGDVILGFPTIWVRTGERWFGAAGLNRTLALRSALLRAIMRESSPPTGSRSPGAYEIRLEAADDGAPPLVIFETDGLSSAQLSKAALHTLGANRCRLSVFDLAAEPFLKNEFAGVFGVLLEEETK